MDNHETDNIEHTMQNKGKQTKNVTQATIKMNRDPQKNGDQSGCSQRASSSHFLLWEWRGQPVQKPLFYSSFRMSSICGVLSL